MCISIVKFPLVCIFYLIVDTYSCFRSECPFIANSKALPPTFYTTQELLLYNFRESLIGNKEKNNKCNTVLVGRWEMYCIFRE